jgi:hypothetical protein
MFRNYAKVALRNLVKHGTYTAINLVSLAVALACCIVAYLNYDYARSYDTFHEHGDQVYRVYSTKNVDGYMQRWGLTPMPLGPALEADFAFVEDAVRYNVEYGVVKIGDQVFNEGIYFADNGFFDLFTFPMKWGTAAALDDPNKIILSEAMAVKYFGDRDPTQEQITLRFSNGATREFRVGGVASTASNIWRTPAAFVSKQSANSAVIVTATESLGGAASSSCVSSAESRSGCFQTANGRDAA